MKEFRFSFVEPFAPTAQLFRREYAHGNPIVSIQKKQIMTRLVEQEVKFTKPIESEIRWMSARRPFPRQPNSTKSQCPELQSRQGKTPKEILVGQPLLTSSSSQERKQSPLFGSLLNLCRQTRREGSSKHATSHTSHGQNSQVNVFRNVVPIISIPILGHERHEFNDPILAFMQSQDDNNGQKSEPFPQSNKLEEIYES